MTRNELIFEIQERFQQSGVLLNERQRRLWAAEEALKNAKSEIDIAKIQSEIAMMAAEITAARKFLRKK